MQFNIGSLYIFLVAAGFVLAVPHDKSPTPALEKREMGGDDENNNREDEAVPRSGPTGRPNWDLIPQDGRKSPLDPASQGTEVEQEEKENNIGGGDDNDEEDEMTRAMEERIEEWNDIPPLPQDLLDAVDYHTRIEVLSFTRALSEQGKADFDHIFSAMRMLKPFISRGRAKIIIENTVNQVKMNRRNGLTVDVLLEEKLRALDVEELEEQMEAMVRFRRKHEGELDPSAIDFRTPLPPPLHMLTWGQDRMLAIAKARAGLVDLEQLKEYILSQDPYMTDRQAATVIKQSLSDFSTVVANFEALVAEPSTIQRVGNWFNNTFRKGANKE